MLCEQLYQIWRDDERDNFAPRNLLRGSTMREPKFLSELVREELDFIHSGKDASINHMLAGGNGFPSVPYATHSAIAAFDAGCTIERRDLRSMLAWARDLNQCMMDRRRGATA